MSSSKDSDAEILARSKYVTDGIAAMNEKLKFNEMALINSIDSVFRYTDDSGKTFEISNTELN
jgi:hypothetical protein